LNRPQARRRPIAIAGNRCALDGRARPAGTAVTFATMLEARSFFRAFVEWYNNEHRRSGIASDSFHKAFVQ
jgi:hypothetical protein